MSQRTVYAVSSGSYSDYMVDCVFERKVDAEQYVAVGMGERVEEMTLYSTMPTLHTVYEATIYKQGGGWGQAGAMRLTDWRTVEEPKHEATASDWAFDASGPDRERVIKSVRDRYAAWKAQAAGIA